MGLKTTLNNTASKMALKTKGLRLPESLLIIPDGNGRWAKQMGVEIYEGHKTGGKTMSKILDDFMIVNIKNIGVWGFSEDNWKRPKGEIDKIMEVIEQTVKENQEKLISNGIKFMCIGDLLRVKQLYPSLYQTLEETEKLTANNTAKTLTLFVNYGERYQLEEFARQRIIDKNTPTYELLSKINRGLPLFDMVLRTSGEMRLSGFGPLVSLAEFVSVDKNLPDLNDDDILESLTKYSNRQRRFGGR